MYARVTRIKADPARTAELVEELKTRMIPLFQQQKGYLGTISSVNRETGEGSTTTYWDTMENLRASEAAIFAARDSFASDQGAQVLSFHRCEIPVREMKQPPEAGRHIRVTTITDFDPAKREQMIANFRDEAAPTVLQQPGSRAALLLVDDENRVAFAISAWDTAEQRDASEAAVAPARQRGIDGSGGRAQVMKGETTHADLKVPINR